MKALRLTRFVLLFCVVASVTAKAAAPVWPITDYPLYWLYGEGLYGLSLDGSYLQSTENYDTNRNINTPTTMMNVQYTNVRAHGALGIAPGLSLFAQVSGSSVLTKNQAGSNIPDGKNIGLGDGFLAARYLLYRSASANRKAPNEWMPNSFLLLLEPSWVFPFYSSTAVHEPPLGDQSNDLSAIVRGVFYLERFFALSVSGGYTRRSSGYSEEIPFSLRGDMNFNPSARGWLEWKGNRSLNNDALSAIPNALNPDQMPGGSLLFKGVNAEASFISGGLAVAATKSLEIVGAIQQAVDGRNSARGTYFSLGLAYRPYRELDFDKEAEKPAKISQVYAAPSRQNKKDPYLYALPIQAVSAKKNYLRIGRGTAENMQLGEAFHIFAPAEQKGEPQLVAAARVVSIQTHTSYLKVETVFQKSPEINTEFEARRINDQP